MPDEAEIENAMRHLNSIRNSARSKGLSYIVDSAQNAIDCLERCLPVGSRFIETRPEAKRIAYQTKEEIQPIIDKMEKFLINNPDYHSKELFKTHLINLKQRLKTKSRR